MFLPGVSATPLQAKASETSTQEVSAEREEGMETAENARNVQTYSYTDGQGITYHIAVSLKRSGEY